MGRNQKDYADQKDYKFCCILYPDATDYNASIDIVLNRISQSGWFEEWYYILHDRDLKPDGTLKKEHYHVVLKKASPSTIGTVSRQLGIPVNYVQRCKSLKGAIKYLVHDEDTDKIPYEVEEVICNDTRTLQSYWETSDEGEIARIIIDYIQTNNCTSIIQLSNWAVNSGYYSVYRRGFALYHSMVKEMVKFT